MTTIDDRLLEDIDTKTIGILKKMNIRGMMYDRIWSPYGNERAIILKEDTERIGWVMLFPSRHNKERLIGYFYVRPKYRRKGYGSLLGYYLDCHYINVFVCPHDPRSRGFFNQLPFSTSSAFA